MTDNLGSIIAVFDNKLNRVFEASYDAWGRQTVKFDEIGLYRGFTGHENVGRSELVNMNHRVYDSSIGRFLSPDNYVQLPENSQSFNRYSYCINNPLKYTDPSGQLFGIDDAVLIFGTFNLFASIIHAKATGQNIWKAAGISILSSAASYGIGGLFSGPLQGISGTFGGELLRAGAHGLASGVTSALSGDNFGRGFLSGAVSSGIGSFASGIDMNDGLMLASCAAAGGLTEWALGGDFLQGAINGLTIGAMNHMQHEPQGLTEEELEKIAEIYNLNIDKDTKTFYASLGGAIAKDAAEHPEWYRNSCAARLSQALNDSEIMTIPNIKGKTFAGADGKYYFMQARAMKNWLAKKLGIPRYFRYKKNSILPNSLTFQEGWENVTGHVDIVFRTKSNFWINGIRVQEYYEKEGIKTYLWRAR